MNQMGVPIQCRLAQISLKKHRVILRMRWGLSDWSFQSWYGKLACQNLVAYGGFHSHGGTPEWMVYFMENPIKMDDLGVPYFRKPPYFE